MPTELTKQQVAEVLKLSKADARMQLQLISGKYGVDYILEELALIMAEIAEDNEGEDRGNAKTRSALLWAISGVFNRKLEKTI
jgi:hypothetical protein